MSLTIPFQIEPCHSTHAADIGQLLLRGFPEWLASGRQSSQQQAQLLAELWLLDRHQGGNTQQWVAVHRSSYQLTVIGTLSLRYSIQSARQTRQNMETRQDNGVQEGIAMKLSPHSPVCLLRSLFSQLRSTGQLFRTYGFWHVSKLLYRLYQLSYQPQPDECYIEHLVVDPAFRRLGIAEQLLIQAQQFCQQQRYRLLSLHVSSDNHYALQLYRKNGFTFDRSHAPFSQSFSYSTLWKYGRWSPASSTLCKGDIHE